MSLIKQLSREDVMFVAGETDTIYQHVAALSVLDNNGRPDFDYEHFRQHCIKRVSLIPPLPLEATLGSNGTGSTLLGRG